MSEICKCCGQTIPPRRAVLNAEQLFAALTAEGRRREVYRAQDGSWWVTYGGGQTTLEAVQELHRAGKIQSVFSNCPSDAYHVGRTIDMPRTLAARQAARNRSITVYVGD